MLLTYPAQPETHDSYVERKDVALRRDGVGWQRVHNIEQLTLNVRL